MSERLFALISNLGPTSDQLKEAITNKLKFAAVPKKHKILRVGEVCDYLYFVEKGLLRAYYERDGQDTSNWFMMENDFLISVRSFYQRVKSYEVIEALEECELYFIHYDDLMDLYERHPEFNVIARKLTEYYYGISEERSFIMRGHQAKKKYIFLMENYSEIIKRVPVKHIASYLGISSDTLSRIRASI